MSCFVFVLFFFFSCVGKKTVVMLFFPSHRCTGTNLYTTQKSKTSCQTWFITDTSTPSKATHFTSNHDRSRLPRVGIKHWLVEAWMSYKPIFFSKSNLSNLFEIIVSIVLMFHVFNFPYEYYYFLFLKAIFRFLKWKFVFSFLDLVFGLWRWFFAWIDLMVKAIDIVTPPCARKWYRNQEKNDNRKLMGSSFYFHFLCLLVY